MEALFSSLAAKYGYVEIIDEIVKTPRINLNPQDNKKRTASCGKAWPFRCYF